ncbi:hypothetical protein N752_02605 [Desulforamulus aquiferis]|nr:hypothetical protein N752_02605 [Desulforamulus aquiferis]
MYCQHSPVLTNKICRQELTIIKVIIPGMAEKVCNIDSAVLVKNTCKVAAMLPKES